MSDDPFADDTPDDAAPAAAAKDAPAETDKEPVDPKLIKKAVSILQGVARGNGVMSQQIKPVKVEGETLNFEGLAFYKIEPQISEKRVTGREKGVVVSSHSDMRQKMQIAQEKAAHNPDVRKHTIQVLKRRADLGIGIENQYVSIDRLRQIYVVHEGCPTCSQNGRMVCKHCNGQGRTECRKCHGTKDMMCPICRGNRTLQTQQGTQQCHRCHGQGRTRCDNCQATGFEQCTHCRTTGYQNCTNCNATGWHSLLGQLMIRAKSHYEYDRDSLPADVPPLIDALGPKLITNKHAKATIIENAERFRELETIAKPDEYIIPYHIRLPYAQIECSLRKGETIPVTLFGFTPQLSDVPPFLEKPLGRGFAALDAAAAGHGNAKLREALRARFIGETVLTALRHPRKKAMRMMQKRYPVGVGADRIQKTVIAADKALKYIIRGPQQMGLAVGAAVGAALYGAYLIGPLRVMAAAAVDNDAAMMGIDAALALAGTMAALLAGQHMARGGVRRALGKLAAKIPAGQLTPKSSMTIIYAAALTLPLFLVMCEAALHVNNAPPAWYREARTQVIPATPTAPLPAAPDTNITP